MPEKIEIRAEAKVEDEKLIVRLFHPKVETKQDVEDMKKLYQLKWLNEKGKEVPLDEIEVSPKEGELSQIETVFAVNKEKPLYIGLRRIPSSLLRFLVKELEEFECEIPDVVQYAIQELNKLIVELDAKKQGVKQWCLGGEVYELTDWSPFEK